MNVPFGLIALPLGIRYLRESYGPAKSLDLGGVALLTAGMFGIVFGLVRANDVGWTSPQIVASLAVGVAMTAAFVAWELRVREPMLPMGFFKSRAFSAANTASLLMFFGMFGSIFLLTQYLQNVQGYSALSAGLHILPWTGMPMIVAPIAGVMSDRIGGRPLIATGLALQAIALAWLAAVLEPTVAYSAIVVPFILAGVGMALFFAPMANVVLDRSGAATPARPRARTTPSASSAGCSGWPCWRRSSPTRVAMDRPSCSPTASRRPCGSALRSSASEPSPEP